MIDRVGFNNGITSKNKNKEKRSVRGKAIIEIFDDDGNIQSKTESHNVVTNMLPFMKYYNNIVGFMAGYGVGEDNLVSRSKADPFSFIYLSELENDSFEQVEEDINRIHPPSCIRLSGYAEREETYSGNSDIKGTINKAESKFYIDQGEFVAHFVFDFPTHAANGAFDCIYWSSSSYTENIPFRDIKYTTDEKVEEVVEVIPFEDGRNENILLCVCTEKDRRSDNRYKYKLSFIYVFDKKFNFLYRREIEKYVLEGKINRTILFNMRSDGNMALIDDVKKKILLYNYETDEVIEEINIPNLYFARNMFYEKSILYTTDYVYGSTSKETFKKYLISDNKSTEKIVEWEENAISEFGIKLQKDKIIAKYKNYTNYTLLDVSEDIKYQALRLNGDNSYSHRTQILQNRKFYLKISFYNNSDEKLAVNFELSIIGCMGAFTKLPSKLTKTETNTMKVQYDFRFEDPLKHLID